MTQHRNQAARGGSAFWAVVITSIAGFITALDNLVVTTALPSIRKDLGGGLEDLEWTVSAYTLTSRSCSCSAPPSATASAAGGCPPSDSRSSPPPRPRPPSPRAWVN